MENPVKLFAWDADGVWWDDLSTSIISRGNKADFRPYMDALLQKGYFTEEHVAYWEAQTGGPVGSVRDIADMITGFYYIIKDKVYAGIPDVEARRRTIEGKQSLLSGVSMGHLMHMADATPFVDGLLETVDAIRSRGIKQVVFSDGCGPFIVYMAGKIGIEVAGILPTIINSGGKRLVMDKGSAYILEQHNATLTGEIVPSAGKSEKIFGYAEKNNIPLGRLAAVDDSGYNAPTLKKINDDGGVGVAFNPTRGNMPKFEEAGVPVIIGKDIRPVVKILDDRRAIKQYCETWGLAI